MRMAKNAISVQSRSSLPRRKELHIREELRLGEGLFA